MNVIPYTSVPVFVHKSLSFGKGPRKVENSMPSSKNIRVKYNKRRASGEILYYKNEFQVQMLLDSETFLEGIG
ncbi:hypothetical protein T07_3368 [Trichinella nelsoni]|uniref:Uncharacterized protein n=1 Tax=Trichinella nelsoni TaxID=6336 RepID=A0A0V0RPM3_9BILA|nr:hypothetical protein T07_3368 [Trichinella nelsoni]